MQLHNLLLLHLLLSIICVQAYSQSGCSPCDPLCLIRSSGVPEYNCDCPQTTHAACNGPHFSKFYSYVPTDDVVHATIEVCDCYNNVEGELQGGIQVISWYLRNSECINMDAVYCEDNIQAEFRQVPCYQVELFIDGQLEGEMHVLQIDGFLHDCCSYSIELEGIKNPDDYEGEIEAPQLHVNSSDTLHMCMNQKDTLSILNYFNELPYQLAPYDLRLIRAELKEENVIIHATQAGITQFCIRQMDGCERYSGTCFYIQVDSSYAMLRDKFCQSEMPITIHDIIRPHSNICSGDGLIKYYGTLEDAALDQNSLIPEFDQLGIHEFVVAHGHNNEVHNPIQIEIISEDVQGELEIESEKLTMCPGESHTFDLVNGQDHLDYYIEADTLVTTSLESEQLSVWALSSGESEICLSARNHCIDTLIQCIVIHIKDPTDCISSATENQSNSIKIGPNPTEGNCFLSGSDLKQVSKVLIYHSSGQVIDSNISSISENRMILDLNNQASGLYTVMIIMRNGNLIRRSLLLL